MKYLGMLTLAMTVWGLVGCQSFDEPFEKLSKLRGIGVASEPVLATPSTEADPHVVVLTVYVSVPLKQDVSVDTFTDKASVLALPAPNLKISLDPTCTDYSSLRLCSFQATFDVPTNDILQLETKKAVRIHYGFHVTAKNQVENIIGDVLVVEADSTELDIIPLAIDVKEPLEADTLKRHHDTNIKAKITNNNDEDVKIGWFISAGALKNRRAESTTWKTGGDEGQTLIGTVRGKRTRSFAFKVMDYQTE